MNYIEQINVFWRLDAEHSFNGNESRLYFYLLNLSNSLYWKNPLTNADGYTATVVGITVNTLKSVRNRLQQAGLISFKSGGKGPRDKCQYWIVPAAQVLRNNAGKVSMVDTINEKTLTPYLIPSLGIPDDIYKHKPDKTKKEKVSAARPPDPEKKSIREKKSGKEDTPEPHWSMLVKCWFDFNIKKFLEKNPGADPREGEPSFEGTPNPRILKKLIGRLRKRAEVKQVEWSEVNAVARLEGFLEAAYRDNWLKDHFLLPNLEKQFDSIIANEKKNGHQHGSSKQGHTHRAVITGAATTAGTL